MTAGAGFLVLFSTNIDEKEVWITAEDGLRTLKACAIAVKRRRF